MIISTQNPKAKRIRRLLNDRRYRHREGAYVVEGTRWLSEIVDSETRPEFVLATTSWLAAAANRDLARKLGIPVLESSEEVMTSVSDAVAPPGVLLVLSMDPRPLPENPTLLLVVDGLRNPGNLGTVLRTAAAAGADGVLLAPGCVDPYNPKVIRGAMGAHLHLPIVPASWPEIEALTAPLVTWLASPAAEKHYDEVDWRQPSALILGGEAAGAGSEATALAAGGLSIPMHKDTESLNAAAAAAIILFEAARQRRT
jgi:TrmH family RNA methyltransferase